MKAVDVKLRYPTEAALCAEFSRWVREGGGTRYEPWTVYPETGGFDLLLVDPHGRQLGVEAKLRLNAKVLVQALPSRWSELDGPDWRGILVPAANGELADLARLHGLVVFTPYTQGGGFDPQLYQAESVHDSWHDFNPAKRCDLPPMVPDLPAGVPSPVRLTPWKVGALKVLAHIEVHGGITAREVRAHGVDPRRFCASDGWLTSLGGGRWARGSVPAFDQQHPAEYRLLLANLQDKPEAEAA